MPVSLACFPGNGSPQGSAVGQPVGLDTPLPAQGNKSTYNLTMLIRIVNNKHRYKKNGGGRGDRGKEKNR